MKKFNKNLIATSLNSNDNLEKPIGRPAYDMHEKLIAEAVTNYIKREKAKKEAETILDIRNKQNGEADKLRESFEYQKTIAGHICNLTKEVNETNKEQLQEQIKQLKSKLAEEEHNCLHDEDEMKRAIGKPPTPCALGLIRANETWEVSFNRLKEHEKNMGIEVSSLETIKKKADERVAQKLGRSTRKYINNIDNSIKKVKKTIARINKNMRITESQKNGRKRDGEQKLREQMNILNQLYAKRIEYEAGLNSEELIIRQIKQLKTKKHGLKIKQRYVQSEFEVNILQEQLFDIELLLVEKQKHLDFIKQSNSNSVDKEQASVKDSNNKLKEQMLKFMNDTIHKIKSEQLLFEKKLTDLVTQS